MSSESTQEPDVPPAENTPQTFKTRWQTLRQRRAVRWGMDFLLFLVLFAGITAYQTRNLLPSGEMAPEFTVHDLDNNIYTQADLTGKPTLLYFWAPWCGVCKVQSPNIAALHKKHGDKYNIYGIALDYGTDEELARYMQEHNIDYPTLTGGRATAQLFNVNSFPTMYVLSSDGEIRNTIIGYTPTLTLRARLALAR